MILDFQTLVVGCLMLLQRWGKIWEWQMGWEFVIEFQGSIGYITGKVDKTGGNEV